MSKYYNLKDHVVERFDLKYSNPFSKGKNVEKFTINYRQQLLNKQAEIAGIIEEILSIDPNITEGTNNTIQTRFFYGLSPTIALNRITLEEHTKFDIEAMDITSDVYQKLELRFLILSVLYKHVLLQVKKSQVQTIDLPDIDVDDISANMRVINTQTLPFVKEILATELDDVNNKISAFNNLFDIVTEQIEDYNKDVEKIYNGNENTVTITSSCTDSATVCFNVSLFNTFINLTPTTLNTITYTPQDYIQIIHNDVSNIDHVGGGNINNDLSYILNKIDEAIGVAQEKWTNLNNLRNNELYRKKRDVENSYETFTTAEDNLASHLIKLGEMQGYLINYPHNHTNIINRLDEVESLISGYDTKYRDTLSLLNSLLSDTRELLNNYNNTVNNIGENDYSIYENIDTTNVQVDEYDDIKDRIDGDYTNLSRQISRLEILNTDITNKLDDINNEYDNVVNSINDELKSNIANVITDINSILTDNNRVIPIINKLVVSDNVINFKYTDMSDILVHSNYFRYSNNVRASINNQWNRHINRIHTILTDFTNNKDNIVSIKNSLRDTNDSININYNDYTYDQLNTLLETLNSKVDMLDRIQTFIDNNYDNLNELSNVVQYVFNNKGNIKNTYINNIDEKIASIREGRQVASDLIITYETNITNYRSTLNTIDERNEELNIQQSEIESIRASIFKTENILNVIKTKLGEEVSISLSDTAWIQTTMHINDIINSFGNRRDNVHLNDFENLLTTYTGYLTTLTQQINRLNTGVSERDSTIKNNIDNLENVYDTNIIKVDVIGEITNIYNTLNTNIDNIIDLEDNLTTLITEYSEIKTTRDNLNNEIDYEQHIDTSSISKIDSNITALNNLKTQINGLEQLKSTLSIGVTINNTLTEINSKKTELNNISILDINTVTGNLDQYANDKTEINNKLNEMKDLENNIDILSIVSVESKTLTEVTDLNKNIIKDIEKNVIPIINYNVKQENNKTLLEAPANKYSEIIQSLDDSNTTYSVNKIGKNTYIYMRKQDNVENFDDENAPDSDGKVYIVYEDSSSGSNLTMIVIVVVIILIILAVVMTMLMS